MHKNQYRKRQRGGLYLPYIIHPLEVLKTIWQWETIDRAMALAAILHDVLEDTDAEESEIMTHFGTDVLKIVQELTCRIQDGVSHEAELQFKADYMASFQTKSIGSLVIKVADRFCNVRDFMLTDPGYANKYYDKAKQTMKILKDRMPEIEKEWGEGPAQNILNAKKKLEVDLRGGSYEGD
jgi:(p)ppGpp synthase/HD superfamily hydrolase